MSITDVESKVVNYGVPTEVVAAVLIDPATGKPVPGGGSGGSGGSAIDFELLLVEDDNGVVGIRRETTQPDGSIVVEYTDLAGDPWTPTPPLRLVSPALPPNAATESTLAALLALNVGEDAGADPLPANFGSLPVAYGYDASDRLTTITKTDGADTWVKTFSYTGDNLTGETAWTKQ